MACLALPRGERWEQEVGYIQAILLVSAVSCTDAESEALLASLSLEDFTSYWAVIGKNEEGDNFIHPVVRFRVANGAEQEVARTVCELLDWKRPTGKLKARECREFLERLEGEGRLELPDKRPGKPVGTRTRIPQTERGEPSEPLEGELSEIQPVVLEVVRSDEQRLLFRELVDRHHYLGHAVPFGAHLRYLVYASAPARVVGCVQLSSPAWRMAARDLWIGWDDATRGRNLQRVVNNSRFLILPWVRVQNLGYIQAMAVFKRELLPDEPWGNAFTYSVSDEPIKPGEASDLVTLRSDKNVISKDAPAQMFVNEKWEEVTVEIFVRVGPSSWQNLGQMQVPKQIGAPGLEKFLSPDTSEDTTVSPPCRTRRWTGFSPAEKNLAPLGKFPVVSVAFLVLCSGKIQELPDFNLGMIRRYYGSGDRNGGCNACGANTQPI